MHYDDTLLQFAAGYRRIDLNIKSLRCACFARIKGGHAETRAHSQSASRQVRHQGQ